VFIGVLEGLDQSQSLIHTSTNRKVIHCNLTKSIFILHLSISSANTGAVGAATFFRCHYFVAAPVSIRYRILKQNYPNNLQNFTATIRKKVSNHKYRTYPFMSVLQMPFLLLLMSSKKEKFYKNIKKALIF
jgi:hypothetical protein